MKFMEIYEVSSEEYKMYDSNIVKIFVQEDVWDFHIFRIIQNEDSYLVEMENLCKDDVREFMEIDSHKDIRSLFKNISEKEVCKKVVEFDIDNGLETWDSVECDSLNEAISIVNEDTYEIINLVVD